MKRQYFNISEESNFMEEREELKNKPLRIPDRIGESSPINMRKIYSIIASFAISLANSTGLNYLITNSLASINPKTNIEERQVISGAQPYVSIATDFGSVISQ